MTDVIGLVGRINSGKTTLAEELAISLKCKKTSFGDVVRQTATERGIELNRKNLQLIGQDLIESSCEIFCKNVLSRVNWEKGEMLIIEGIRHFKIVEELKKIVYPQKLKIIYIDIDDETVVQRDKENEFGKIDNLKIIEADSTEMEVKTSLKSVADLVINGKLSVTTQVNEIIHSL